MNGDIVSGETGRRPRRVTYVSRVDREREEKGLPPSEDAAFFVEDGRGDGNGNDSRLLAEKPPHY